MTRLTWHDLPRDYEKGVDHGVLYFGDHQKEAVIWNGLINVREQTEQSAGAPRYFEGIPYLLEQEIADYQASVDAYVYPYMLEDHVLAMVDGRTLVAEAPETQPFGFTYRTKKLDGYRIHIVYNIVATIENVTHATLTDQTNLTPFTFTFHTTPVDIPGARPSAHLIVDTTEADESALFEVEKMLYGSDETHPRFPSVSDLMAVFSS